MMTKEEMKIAVAESMGWKRKHVIDTEDESPTCSKLITLWRLGENYPIEEDRLPNYPQDLNAMHEAEKTLTGIDWVNYTEQLGRIQRRDKCDAIWHLNALQRCEAYLRVKGLWK